MAVLFDAQSSSTLTLARAALTAARRRAWTRARQDLAADPSARALRAAPVHDEPWPRALVVMLPPPRATATSATLWCVCSFVVAVLACSMVSTARAHGSALGAAADRGDASTAREFSCSCLALQRALAVMRDLGPGAPAGHTVEAATAPAMVLIASLCGGMRGRCVGLCFARFGLRLAADTGPNDGRQWATHATAARSPGRGGGTAQRGGL